MLKFKIIKFRWIFFQVLLYMLKTNHIEYQGEAVRETNKNHLTKVEKIRPQNGAFKSGLHNKSRDYINNSIKIKKPPLPIGRKTYRSDEKALIIEKSVV